MTRIAAVMPTRNRVSTAGRAIQTFVAAALKCSEIEAVLVCVVDDSDIPESSRDLVQVVEKLTRSSPRCNFAIERPSVHGNRESGPQRRAGGPGAARNRGLAYFRSSDFVHDVLVMFDDDVCFTSTVYRGVPLACAGEMLIQQALEGCRDPRVIVGCDYIGRQDLSILEHARLAGTLPDEHDVAPATVREEVDHVAPGGISSAFLMISATARELPDFAEHYNEDYLWLHGLEKRGWKLKRVSEALIHAPPGAVSIAAGDLGFQIFGEIVWLAVLETRRYPFGVPTAMAAAVEEIVGDLRHALLVPEICGDHEISRIIRSVAEHYETMRDDLKMSRVTSGTQALLAAINAGLESDTVPRTGCR